jgi:uncharacterized membrane protein YhaH (DUF805 family)
LFFVRVMSGALLCSLVTMLSMLALTIVFFAVGTMSHFAFAQALQIGSILGACAGAVIWGGCVRPARALAGTAIFFPLPFLFLPVVMLIKRVAEPNSPGVWATVMGTPVLVAGIGAATGFFIARLLPACQDRVDWLGRHPHSIEQKQQGKNIDEPVVVRISRP